MHNNWYCPRHRAYAFTVYGFLGERTIDAARNRGYCAHYTRAGTLFTRPDLAEKLAAALESFASAASPVWKFA